MFENALNRAVISSSGIAPASTGVPRRAVAPIFLLVAALALLILAASAAFAWKQARKPDRGLLIPASVTLPADGRLHQASPLRLSGGGHLRAQDVFADGLNAKVIEDGGNALVAFSSPVNPSSTSVALTYEGRRTMMHIQFAPDAGDEYQDGTPDFLRLHGAADRQAFRAWFSTLADTAAALPAGRLPKEIDDCAALLRWSYRGALHAHDEAWLQTLSFESLPPLTSVLQYAYPLTPLGTGLFRVRQGAYTEGDAINGGFAQFADARTLMQRNAYFLTRDVSAAKQGDLLFYRQLEQDSVFHSMILTGADHSWAVYDTGPIGHAPGEVRRVALDDLLRHPDRRWRPVAANTNFLGVYRWNILREDYR